MRGRYVNPRIFEDYELDDAERDTKLPVFKTLVGLWCHADRAGRFVWDLRKLQIHLFPFQPQIDLAAILSILRTRDVVKWYEADGKQYGWLVKFREYQYLSGKEPESLLPPHPEDDLSGTECAQGGTGAAPVAEAEAEADQRSTMTEADAEADNINGTISTSGAPRTSDSTITTHGSAPTMTKSQRTTLVTTASM
jgi:hypothetical protein